MEQWITAIVNNKIELLQQLEKTGYINKVEEVGKSMSKCIRNGGKIILAGNGGSAADAQHFAGEMVGRFLMERNAIPAISICVDPSVMTCIGNDYGYDEIFRRQLQGLGNQNDIFVAISTSGNSKNLINTVEMAKDMKILTVGLLGKNGGKLGATCDESLIVPSDIIPRIQEIHTLTVHILCEMIEKEIFGIK